ncbi:peptidase [Candidatus Aerophobetes bacterium]|uniref:Peptidase n=1 Tax=Aerophobetes bacterium TaxID=2030807 RepID=A0A2A4X336_UNCAE|nr:MAG: peptidase [Candidatus Aerophobetes bacterium]
MKSVSSISSLLFFIIFLGGVVLEYTTYGPNIDGFWLIGGGFILAVYVSSSIKIADQWDCAVVLRLGKFHGLKGPGLFFIIPLIDRIVCWIDTRTLTTAFKAEKTLTKDTVPVDVDAVLFWKVIDPKKAALEVAEYQNAINWAAQTALRDVIGKTELSDMLEGREKIDKELLNLIDGRTQPWGIQVSAVEIKDVLIPQSLENSMSMQAQAERERQARVILGDSERQIAEKFAEASVTYQDNPVAFHLRAMNMLYEGLKNDNSTIVIVPSSAVDSMQLGAYTGMAALTMGIDEKNKAKNKAKKEASLEKKETEVKDDIEQNEQDEIEE